MDVGLSEEQIKGAVRRRYSELATLNEPCCESSCCTTTESASVPSEALQVGASCGSPLTHTTVEVDQVVLDLGSGEELTSSKPQNLSGKMGK